MLFELNLLLDYYITKTLNEILNFEFIGSTEPVFLHLHNYKSIRSCSACPTDGQPTDHWYIQPAPLVRRLKTHSSKK